MSGTDPRRLLTRLLAALRLGWGTVLLTRPDDVVRALAAGPDRPRRWIVRLLGARLVVQHVVVLVAPDRRVVLGGVAVDTLHAASMLAAAQHWPRLRRAALVSAGSTAAAAALEALSAPVARSSSRAS